MNTNDPLALKPYRQSLDTQHTPGPWAEDDTQAHYPGYVIRNQGMVVCRIYVEGNPIERQMANARLIAAAPKMLAWIKRMAYWAGELEDSPKSFAEGAQAQMDEARAILRDVEGK